MTISDLRRSMFPSAYSLAKGTSTLCVNISSSCKGKGKWRVNGSGDDFCAPCYAELIRRFNVGMDRLLDDVMNGDVADSRVKVFTRS